jgi:recombination protein RecA
VLSEDSERISPKASKSNKALNKKPPQRAYSSPRSKEVCADGFGVFITFRRTEEKPIYVNIFSFKLDFCFLLSIFVSKLNLNKRQIMAGKAEIQKKAANKVANDKNLNLAISGINKQFGPGALMRLGEATKMEVDKISTGSIAIDLALGIGGLPKGRVCEIYGPESSGKTTFCLSIIAEAQKQGGNAVFIDVEHALDPKYAKVVGVDLENLMVSQPECGEDALNITETLIRSGAIDIIVIDSVAALVSKNELDGQMGDSTVGLQARMMSQAMRRLTGAINKTQCVVLFTNQIREKIGVMFGSPETQPGGRALKFFSSVRLDIRRIGQIKETSGKVIGNRTRLKVVKNKVAPPFTDCEFDIMYNEGISHSGSLVDLGVEHKILEKKGSWISFKGEMVGQGREAAKQAIMTDPKLADELTGLILDKVHPKVGESIASSTEEDSD